MALTKSDKKDIKNIVMEALGEFFETALLPTFATKNDLVKLTKRFDEFQAKSEGSFSDLGRQIRDVSLDTPTRREFNKHEVRIAALEPSVGL